MATRIELDREAGSPLYRQIARELGRRIEARTLGPGVKLPSSRDLAVELRVHRTTVTAAYRELRKQGYVESGVGQGTFVSSLAEVRGAGSGSPDRGDSARTPRGTIPDRYSWSEVLRPPERGPELARVTATTTVMDRALPDPSLYPTPALDEILVSLLQDSDEDLFCYCPSEGDERLRAALRERLSRWGIDFERNDILIVGGSQQGLDLVSRLLLREGGTVAVDAPTYRGALEVFRLHGADVVGVPMAKDGTDLDRLESLVSRGRVRLIYMMPTLHNPTGLSLTTESRRRLVDISYRAQVPILEDDWLADLRTPDDPPPAKAFDHGGLVIYSGTFSKTAVPGLRVGWLVVPIELHRALVNLKSHCDLCTSLLGQRALDRLLRTDFYEDHLNRVRKTYENRVACGLRALERHLPSLEWTEPRGGIVNWLHLPPGVEGREVARTLAERGILVSPGEIFLPRESERGGLRLCYSLSTSDEIEAAIAVLAETLTGILKRRRGESRTTPAPLV